MSMWSNGRKLSISMKYNSGHQWCRCRVVIAYWLIIVIIVSQFSELTHTNMNCLKPILADLLDQNGLLASIVCWPHARFFFRNKHKENHLMNEIERDASISEYQIFEYPKNTLNTKQKCVSYKLLLRFGSQFFFMPSNVRIQMSNQQTSCFD